MIGTDIAAFLEGPVMILLSTCDGADRAGIARGSSIRFDRRNGHIHVLFSGSQWPDVGGNVATGARIAVTVVRPSDYRAFQIKGIIGSAAPASGEEQQRATAYVARMLEVMAELGVTTRQLSHTLTDRDLVRVSFLPTDLYAQTPGPGAGQRLGQAPI
ncbi:hypothetical protein OMP43_20710 [Sphingomonas sp. CBMAI 2297]|uniref:hypothetical protein n=1 Tax=Sphingomonas sp. CBMAI 2297 TaxID=2991720 RepID=UPI0024568FF2|nr:hypothetical protein [Sphingomonas sp. CBMAI 2297]MDH4746452.1 hypothetical protein [Sphingomonas sp. CBMAI 2297]